ncbi:MAG: tyrosine-type recombinase/integrase [Clostridia bacterium]|nr:tyrosine-type recombinase/integrase [Clostridia bacterium]
MKMRTLNPQTPQNFHAHLLSEEKSENTTQKYLKDAEAFARYLDGQGVTKETVLRYKNHLLAQRYAPASINSKLASLNSLFSFLGWFDCKVKTVKIQRCVYCPEDKELSKDEYVRLINAARQKRNRRLTLLLQTICGTGIRVSELMHITVEAARCGRAAVSLKGKTRVVFLVDELCRRLLQYAQQRKIQSGPIFITRSGAPMSRQHPPTVCPRAL